LLDELFGARLSSGTVDAVLQRTAAALDEPHEDLLDHVRCAPAVNIDETGWRLKGKRRTLWGAATPVAAVFRIAPDRHERGATCSWARTSKASSAPTAGGPTAASTPPAASSAGRT
jgi:hypothetical protein